MGLGAGVGQGRMRLGGSGMTRVGVSGGERQVIAGGGFALLRSAAVCDYLMGMVRVKLVVGMMMVVMVVQRPGHVSTQGLVG